jgi:hypothetical protein
MEICLKELDDEIYKSRDREYTLKDIHIVRTQSLSTEGSWSTMSGTLYNRFGINEDTVIRYLVTSHTDNECGSFGSGGLSKVFYKIALGW